MQKYLSTSLALERCPHCVIAHPQLARVTERENNRRGIHRRWGVYECLACGGLVTAAARAGDPLHAITECYPGAPDEPSDTIPARAREYLRQARDLLGQPTGSVTLSASAVDAMLKEKGLKEGRLYERIHDAVAQNLISEDMAQWAHQVSLDPNDSRYADEWGLLPTTESAQRCLRFALTLADVLFVLPGRVMQGIAESEPLP
ncbi:MAG TPA: DUF4145 domain-containing protein [Tepidiformaceae bacterium]|nr:DUF4145 domain-containing protein [Tepidiformaceae bacterium]